MLRCRDVLGLNRTDMRMLDFLGRTGDPTSFEGAPITAGDLARASGLTTGAVTAVVDRLEKGGWVRRRADPPTAAASSSSSPTRRCR